jgi:hypothetical protein
MATRDHAGEIDGLDEIICPVDFDWTDTHAIRDKDFKRIFSAIPVGCEFVWISDSCHSGDLSKDLSPPNITYKFMPAPADIQWKIDSAIESGRFNPLTINGAALPNSVALIYGCQSDQTSADAIFNNKPNGVLTYFLLDSLTKNDGLTVSIDMLIDRVKKNLVASKYKQIPDVEGSPDIIKKPFLVI